MSFSVESFNRYNDRLSRIRPLTLEEILAPENAWRTLEDIMKADPMPLIVGNDEEVEEENHIDARRRDRESYEARLGLIGAAVRQGCGCSHKPTYTSAGSRDVNPRDEPVVENPHVLTVLDTFADCALVRCENERKAWLVRFFLDDSGAVITNGCIEQVETFKPIGKADSPAHGGARTMRTLEQIMNDARGRPVRKVDDGAYQSRAVTEYPNGTEDLNVERRLSAQIAALDTMISASRGIVALYQDDPVETMSDETKAIVREANRSLEASLAQKADLERRRAGVSAPPEALAKRADVADAVQRFAFAKGRFDDAVAGRLGRLSPKEQQEIRVAFTRAEMELNDARAQR